MEKMDEYIKRQDAIDELMEMVKEHSGDQFGGVLLHYTGIKAMLECIEPANVRPDAIALEPAPKHLRQYQTMNLDDAYEDGWYGAQAAISQLPLADVKPVVRGKWESHGEGFKLVYICSACGYVDGYPMNDRMNFCPHCGADMRGDDAE